MRPGAPTSLSETLQTPRRGEHWRFRSRAGDGSGLPIRRPLRKTHLSRSIGITILLLAGTSGCGAGWHRVEEPPPSAFRPRDQVQVWQDGKAILLHGVRLKSDTLSGVPFTQPPTCDSCRVHLGLTGVDSLRVGNKERGFFRTVGLVMGIGLVWAYLFRGVGGD